MYKIITVLNVRNLIKLFMFSGLSLLCAFIISVPNARAGSTGNVDIYKENSECNAQYMYFRNNRNIDTDGEGRGRVNVKQNGDVSATCNYNVANDQKPETRDVNTSFDCNIWIDGVRHRASNRKATLNTNGKVSMSCKTTIPTQTNGTNSDSGKEKGSKSKKPK
jgi:hypothetical protein